MLAIVSITDDSYVAGRILSTDFSPASQGDGFELGVESGNAYCYPAQNSSDIAPYARYIKDKGYVVIGGRHRAGHQTSFVAGVMHVISANTLTRSPNLLYMFTGGAGFGFIGKITKFLFFTQCLTDAEWLQTLTQAVADHAITGETAPASLNQVFTEGDSITAQSSAWGWFAAAKATSVGANIGIPGSQLADLLTRAPDVDARIDQATALGQNFILVVQIGANNGSELLSAPATLAAGILAYCAARKARGAKVILAPIFHQVGQTAINAGIDTCNTALAAGTSNYTAFADTRGLLTETIGVDYVDGVHLNASGYSKVNPPIQTQITAQLV